MPVNTAVEGREYPRTAPYVISRAKIAEFAAAVGAESAEHTDPEAARAAGHADGEAAAIGDPEAEIDFSRLVHGEQAFVHHRPAVAGDEVTAQTTVTRVRIAGGHSMVTLTTEVRTAEDPICTATSLMVIRGDN
jgi:acyl dehydratase